MGIATLKQIFDHACSEHPNLMEPWIIRLGQVESCVDQERIMRSAMAETIKQRYPVAEKSAIPNAPTQGERNECPAHS